MKADLIILACLRRSAGQGRRDRKEGTLEVNVLDSFFPSCSSSCELSNASDFQVDDSRASLAIRHVLLHPSNARIEEKSGIP